MAQELLVLITFPSQEEALATAQVLVDESLAACVNLTGPVSSIYRWQGQVESAQEWLALVKTNLQSFDALSQRVRELHSYSVPEIIGLEAAAIESNYADWLLNQLKIS